MMPSLLSLLFAAVFLASSASAETYFPVTRATEFTLGRWYPAHLRAMREPSLYQCISQPTEEFRFLYLPSFNHPISIRITKSGQNVSLRAVMLDGKGGYAPGRILVERHRTLSLRDWSRLQNLLNRSHFWELPTADQAVGLDGSQWVFEASGGYRYRLLERWSPVYDTRKRGLGRIVDLGRYLMSLSGIQSDEPLY